MYPWYSTGKRYAGPNGRAAYSLFEHCETGEKRRKLDILVGRRIKSSFLNPGESMFHAANRLLSKKPLLGGVQVDQEILDDLMYLEKIDIDA